MDRTSIFKKLHAWASWSCDLSFILPKYGQILYAVAVRIHMKWICVSYEGGCLQGRQGQIYAYMDAFHWHTMGKSGDTA